MKLVDIGNINDEAFCAEFDKKIPLEEAANAIADEYRAFTRQKDISLRKVYPRESSKASYSIELRFAHQRLSVESLVSEPIEVYNVVKGPFGQDFEEFHAYLQAKHTPSSEE